MDKQLSNYERTRIEMNRYLMKRSSKRGRKQTPEIAERNKRIIELRDRGHTLDYIGKLFEITRERVRQIVSKAV
jgi:DNA-directed RNA polymerase sigma subunit (sigma70/sigma32)